MYWQAIAFVLLISILRFTIELGLSKQGTNSTLLTMPLSQILHVDKDSPVWMYIANIVPIVALTLLAYMLYKSMPHSNSRGIMKYVIRGTIFSYMLVGVCWALESNLLSFSQVHKGVTGDFIPRIIYAIGFVQLLSLALAQLFKEEKLSRWEDSIVIKSVAMLSAWSATVILLSGKQGGLVALASISGGTYFFVTALYMFIYVSTNKSHDGEQHSNP